MMLSIVDYRNNSLQVWKQKQIDGLAMCKKRKNVSPKIHQKGPKYKSYQTYVKIRVRGWMHLLTF